jgi:hypothetical protein
MSHVDKKTKRTHEDKGLPVFDIDIPMPKVKPPKEPKPKK